MLRGVYYANDNTNLYWNWSARIGRKIRLDQLRQQTTHCLEAYILYSGTCTHRNLCSTKRFIVSLWITTIICLYYTYKNLCWRDAEQSPVHPNSIEPRKYIECISKKPACCCIYFGKQWLWALEARTHIGNVCNGGGGTSRWSYCWFHCCCRRCQSMASIEYCCWWCVCLRRRSPWRRGVYRRMVFFVLMHSLPPTRCTHCSSQYVNMARTPRFLLSFFFLSQKLYYRLTIVRKSNSYIHLKEYIYFYSIFIFYICF